MDVARVYVGDSGVQIEWYVDPKQVPQQGLSQVYRIAYELASSLCQD